MPGLAALSRVSLEDCIAAVEQLSGPDKWSRTQEHEGRRIAPADGGWVLLNHGKYRAAQNADDRRERSRIAMAALRESRRKRQQALTVNKGEDSVNRGDQSCSELTQAEAEAKAVNPRRAARASASVPWPCPNGVDPVSWQAWLDARAKKRAPATQAALDLALRKLAELGKLGYPPDQVVRASAEAGWTGLFQPKDKPQGQAAAELPWAQQGPKYADDVPLHGRIGEVL
jgi:hypothetical protein